MNKFNRFLKGEIGMDGKSTQAKVDEEMKEQNPFDKICEEVQSTHSKVIQALQAKVEGIEEIQIQGKVTKYKAKKGLKGDLPDLASNIPVVAFHKLKKVENNTLKLE